jgi:hypothetical protein
MTGSKSIEEKNKICIMRTLETASKSEKSHSSKPNLKEEVNGPFFNTSTKPKIPFFEHNIIQRKLERGQANDKYEKEADAVANLVVMPSNVKEPEKVEVQPSQKVDLHQMQIMAKEEEMKPEQYPHSEKPLISGPLSLGALLVPDKYLNPQAWKRIDPFYVPREQPTIVKTQQIRLSPHWRQETLVTYFRTFREGGTSNIDTKLELKQSDMEKALRWGLPDGTPLTGFEREILESWGSKFRIVLDVEGGTVGYLWDSGPGFDYYNRYGERLAHDSGPGLETPAVSPIDFAGGAGGAARLATRIATRAVRKEDVVNMILASGVVVSMYTGQPAWTEEAAGSRPTPEIEEMQRFEEAERRLERRRVQERSPRNTKGPARSLPLPRQARILAEAVFPWLK